MPPNHFRKDGKLHLLEIEPAAWKMLCVVWGKPSITVQELAEGLGKSRRTKYNSLKPTVTRLNNAMNRAKLPFYWTKKRGENILIYNSPPLSSSVSV